MIQPNSLVLYKNNVAIVLAALDGGKFSIRFRTSPLDAKKTTYNTLNVREKDFILLSSTPSSSLENVLKYADSSSPNVKDLYNLEQNNSLALMVKEVWELLSSDSETENEAIEWNELSLLIKSDMKADEAWGIYLALCNTLYFALCESNGQDGKIIFKPRSKEEIDSLIQKATLKGKESELKGAFLKRLKKRELDLPSDGVYMTDVEALALGRTDKSRTMHDAHIKETPEKAHQLLLDTSIWSITRNPYPLRWGLSMKSATEGLPAPPEEERLTIDTISYAIDNEWSTDPDDAVAWDGKYLWVHIADPASAVMPDSSIDKSARARGATLYIPEGASRMLCEDSLADYALGLKELSNALSFRLLLDDKGDILECEVLKTLVRVKRLSYEKADTLKDSEELKPLFDIANRNIVRRKANGSVNISLPEVHIIIDEAKNVRIEPEIHPQSADMVREMMLLAGEGAARYAFKNGLPFPFVSQESPTLPSDIPDGLAGQFRLRRCMHRRSVGITPSLHAGIGVGMYSQVTSPLRRYGDLIAHMQLRAFLDGRTLLDKDVMLMRVMEGEAAAQAAHKAERKSNMHWTLVYLLQNPSWQGEAICVDVGGRQNQFFIPSLAMETFITCSSSIKLNDSITVRAGNINLPELTVDFIPV